MKTLLRFLAAALAVFLLLMLSGCVGPSLVRETKTRLVVPTQHGPASLEFGKDAKIAKLELVRDPATGAVQKLVITDLQTSASSVIDSAAVAQAEANKALAEGSNKVLDLAGRLIP